MTIRSIEYVRMLEEALAFLKGGDDYLVVSHVQPDGDAVSSTVIIHWLLEKLGKRAVLVNEGRIPPRLQYLRSSEFIVNLSENKPERTFSRIVTVDCADFRRVGRAEELFSAEYALLNIDHHPTNDAFGSTNLLRFDAAATAEILFDLIEHAGIPLDVEVATAIYTGLLTDTGGFRYSNTTAHVMAIASRLLDAGVNGFGLADHLLEQMSLPQLRVLQRGLSRLALSEDGRIGWLYIEPSDMAETGAAGEDLEGLVNYARNIEGVEVGMLFKVTESGEVKVSLRSAGAADVAAIAQSFGGGGHVRAAGCRVDGPIGDAMTAVVGSVRKALDRV
ncbi:DHH family phosphoesterase [Paenibacillus darwinianus]|uniref:DHH family phosphoesterase n=1 Tax=Paenibacillus darwinianus TaxID=1380763 RepID=UPI00044B6DD5|nr:bifunctional oligoribonuclease/PAP phosphatase NrnA [Paenibacillus darwinianus]EXX92140.1 exopolyphosphatase [Paenibacillus darwinianus]EXX92791.1 exopolyphosphatase [Paenibacillus darwinianus]